VDHLKSLLLFITRLFSIWLSLEFSSVYFHPAEVLFWLPQCWPVFSFSLVLFGPFFSLRGAHIGPTGTSFRPNSFRPKSRRGRGEVAAWKGEIAAVVGGEPVRRGRRRARPPRSSPDLCVLLLPASGGCGASGTWGRHLRRARPQGKRRSPKSLAVLLLLAVNDVFREW
jgi:hypothetical protein